MTEPIQVVAMGDATICDSLLIPSQNFSYMLDVRRPAGERVILMTLDGAALDPERIYRVAVNNFLAGGGDGFATFAHGDAVASAGFDVDAVEAYVAQGDIAVPRCGRVKSASGARPVGF